MNRWLLYALLCLTLGCTRPETMVPSVTLDVEPTLTDMRTPTDSLFMETQAINARTASNAIDVFCSYRINASAFRRNIREVGVCLSPSDSLLSIKNAAQLRVKATYDSTKSSFTASLTIPPGQKYYLSAYFMLKDGRVYYGSQQHTARWQFPSWGPKPTMNAVTSFSITQPAAAAYQPLTIAQRAPTPVRVSVPDDYFFVLHNTLHLLATDGTLYRYASATDQWVAQPTRLKVPFDGFPALVFALSNKAYVFYTSAWTGRATYGWSYDYNANTWTSLPTPNTFVASLKLAYQRGDEVVLRDVYNKVGFRFDPIQQQFVSLNSSSILLKEPDSYINFVNNASLPTGYFMAQGDWQAGPLYQATYDAVRNDFVQEQLVSAQPTDATPRLSFSMGQDLFFGLGMAYAFLPTSRIYTNTYTSSDELIRYSPQTGQLVARYDVSALRAGYANGVSGNYRVFVVGGQTLVIDIQTGRMWQLQL